MIMIKHFSIFLFPFYFLQDWEKSLLSLNKTQLIWRVQESVSEIWTWGLTQCHFLQQSQDDGHSFPDCQKCNVEKTQGKQLWNLGIKAHWRGDVYVDVCCYNIYIVHKYKNNYYKCYNYDCHYQVVVTHRTYLEKKKYSHFLFFFPISHCLQQNSCFAKFVFASI